MGQSRLFNDAAAARRARRADKKAIEASSFKANRLREAIEYLRSAAGAIEEAAAVTPAGPARDGLNTERSRLLLEAARLADPFRYAAMSGGWGESDILDTVTGR